jgi:hypothetical protein
VVWQNDTGVAADGITQDGQYLNIMGAEIGSNVHVEITKNGTALTPVNLSNTAGSPIQIAASSWGVTGDGNYEFKLSQTDAAGNASVLTATPISLKLDTAAPSLTFQSNSRAVNSGASVVSMTEQSAVNLQFLASEAMKSSLTVDLLKGTTSYASLLSYSLDTAKTTFTLTGNLSSLTRGAYSLVVKSTDLAGNSVETTQALFLDKVSFLDAFPNYINASQVSSGWTLSGTTSGVETGQTVSMSLSATGMTALTKTAQVGTGGVFSAAFTSGELTALAEKNYTLSYSVSDTAGHTASGTQTVLLDKTAPTVTLSMLGPDGVAATSIDQTMVTDGFSFAGQVAATPSGPSMESVTVGAVLSSRTV